MPHNAPLLGPPTDADLWSTTHTRPQAVVRWLCMYKQTWRMCMLVGFKYGCRCRYYAKKGNTWINVKIKYRSCFLHIIGNESYVRNHFMMLTCGTLSSTLQKKKRKKIAILHMLSSISIHQRGPSQLMWQSPAKSSFCASYTHSAIMCNWHAYA